MCDFFNLTLLWSDGVWSPLGVNTAFKPRTDSVPDPDLDMMRGERSSRPLDKGGGEAHGLRKFFWPPRAAPLDSPLQIGRLYGFNYQWESLSISDGNPLGGMCFWDPETLPSSI